MLTTPTSRVQKVAALVQRLDRSELRELLRLVPRLREDPESGTDNVAHAADLMGWVREELSRYAAEAQPMHDDDRFLGGMTVAAYFVLPEAERERIWDEMYAEAIEAAPEREIKPDANISARQKHRPRNR